jgi:hypothetical protein
MKDTENEIIKEGVRLLLDTQQLKESLCLFIKTTKKMKLPMYMKSGKDNKTIIVKWWGVLYLKLRYVYLSHVLGLWMPINERMPIESDNYHQQNYWVKSKDKRTGKVSIFVCNYWNGRWTNLDTWEDFDNEVTHWKKIRTPRP